MSDANRDIQHDSGDQDEGRPSPFPELRERLDRVITRAELHNYKISEIGLGPSEYGVWREGIKEFTSFTGQFRNPHDSYRGVPIHRLSADGVWVRMF